LELGAKYDVHLRLIGKLMGDFLLVIIELFSLGAFVLSQYTRLTDGRTDRQNLDSNTVRMLRSRTVKTDDKPQPLNTIDSKIRDSGTAGTERIEWCDRHPFHGSEHA